MTSGQIVLVRHGETRWSRDGRHTGLTDLPLTADGEAQARSLRPHLADRPFALALTSPLRRAARTAELAGLEATVDPDLVEWDYGAYEGVTTADIQRERPGWSLWDDGVPPGDAAHPGETAEQVGVRLDRVLRTARAALPHGDVVLVAHGHTLRVLGARWLGLEVRDGRLLTLGTAARCVLGHDHGTAALVHWNLPPGGISSPA